MESDGGALTCAPIAFRSSWRLWIYYPPRSRAGSGAGQGLRGGDGRPVAYTRGQRGLANGYPDSCFSLSSADMLDLPPVGIS